MSHFNRWWSKQRIKDKEAKRFSHTVWNEAAKPYQVTIDKLTAELAEVREEYGHKCAKCGSVLQLVRPGKHQCQYCEMESALTAELAKYKQGVEVEGNYIWWEQCIANVSLDKDKFRGKKVKAFVIPIEESCDE